MGLWWLCCPIGNSLQTAFIEDGNGLLESGDDGPRALQHQDAGASSPEEPPQNRGRARTEDSTTAALLTAEARPSDRGAPTHRRTISSSSKISLPKEIAFDLPITGGSPSPPVPPRHARAASEGDIRPRAATAAAAAAAAAAAGGSALSASAAATCSTAAATASAATASATAASATAASATAASALAATATAAAAAEAAAAVDAANAGNAAAANAHAANAASRLAAAAAAAAAAAEAPPEAAAEAADGVAADAAQPGQQPALVVEAEAAEAAEAAARGRCSGDHDTLTPTLPLTLTLTPTLTLALTLTLTLTQPPNPDQGQVQRSRRRAAAESAAISSRICRDLRVEIVGGRDLARARPRSRSGARSRRELAAGRPTSRGQIAISADEVSAAPRQIAISAAPRCPVLLLFIRHRGEGQGEG